jgi:hypothetical protein
VTRRLLAAAPLVLAALLYAGVALPLRARAAAARDAYADARRDRQQAQAALLPLERREAVRRQAQAAFAEAATREGGAAAALRRSVLGALDGSAASAVRLGVRPSPVGPTVRVSAVAPYAEGLRIAGDLARPATGLVLQRVTLEPHRGDRRQVGLEVEAQAFPVAP